MTRNAVRMLLVSLVVVGPIGFSVPYSRAQSAGETLYKAKCAMCHGADGKGEVPMGKKLNARNLGSTEVQSQSDAQLTEVLTKGKNKMPAYESKLSKDQIVQLVAYIREIGKKH